MVYGYPKSVYEWKGVPAFPVDAVLQGALRIIGVSQSLGFNTVTGQLVRHALFLSVLFNE